MNYDNLNNIECRMYENDLPQEGDLVMVKVIDVEENGARCELLEYANISGLLPATEYSRKRIKSIKKIVKPGNRDVLTVLRVDTEKRYIDLSKKHVTPQEIQDVSSRFQKSNFVHSTLRQMCINHPEVTLQDMYESIGWPLSRIYGHAYDGMFQAAKNEDVLNALDLDGNIRNELTNSLHKKFQEKPQTLSAIVSVTCIGPKGVIAVKEALLQGINVNSTNSCDVQFTVLSPPDYCISCKCMESESENIRELIQQIIEAIKESILSQDGGHFAIKQDICVQNENKN